MIFGVVILSIQCFVATVFENSLMQIPCVLLIIILNRKVFFKIIEMLKKKVVKR